MSSTALAVSLWAHQQQAVQAALDAIAAGTKSGLWVICTGGGKTRTSIALARMLGVPVGVLVHRDFLIDQWRAAAAEWWPEASVGVIQADRDDWDRDLSSKAPDIVVAMAPSLHAARLARLPRDRFGLLISDECHRSVTRGWSQIIQHFDFGFHLGVTATPDRLDGKGLARHFGKEPLINYGIKQAIGDRVLVEPRQRAILTNVNLDDVKANAKGVIDQADLSKHVSIDARNLQIVDAYKTYATGRKAVAFCVDLDHVHALTAAFNAAAIPAVAVTGQNREERKAQLAGFAEGKFSVCVNCEVLTEGADIKAVDCILWCRPTKSKLLYMQGVGRGLRQAAGKLDCLILDFVDSCRVHKLVTLCNLLGLPQQSLDGAGAGKAMQDQADEEEAAKVKAVQQLLTFPLSWAAEEVSPWPDLPSLKGYQPSKRWHDEPASEKQLTALRRFSLDAGRELTKGEASWLFDRAREYEFVFPTPATARQQRFLERAGEWREGIGKREAGKIITRLKQAVGDARGG